jgi:hypothetical protein
VAEFWCAECGDQLTGEAVLDGGLLFCAKAHANVYWRKVNEEYEGFDE